MANRESAPKPVVIKKYANRRLYDTETSAYITLEDLYQRVKDGKDFTVVDAKTGQDLTRQVLTQIIFEQETKGFNVLPTEFLRSVIGFYDHGMQDVLQNYLQASMKSFVANQDRFKTVVGKTMGDLPGFNQLEEMTKHNVAFFEKAFGMFNPFGNVFSAKDADEGGKNK